MEVRDFSKLYFGLLILHLAVIYKPESEALYNISKPAMLFSLAAFFIHRTPEWSKAGRYWVTGALLAAFAGDVLLLSSVTDNIQYSLFAFAFSHMAYSGFYARTKKLSPKYSYTIPVAVLCAAGAYLMIDQLGFIGGSTPLLYGFLAVASFHLVTSTQFAANFGGRAWLTVIGAVLFSISNAILIYNRVEGSSKYWEIAMATTYAVAHFLIAISLLEFLETRSNKSDSATP